MSYVQKVSTTNEHGYTVRCRVHFDDDDTDSLYTYMTLIAVVGCLGTGAGTGTGGSLIKMKSA
jgi:hypothetical protein